MSHEEQDYIARLHKYGFRVTVQRLMVLDAVCDIGGHATLSAISQRVEELDPSIAPSTIYRALDVLLEAKLIVSSEIDGIGKVYEIAGEMPHHHLVCKQCGDVQMLTHDAVRPFLNHLRNEYGFCVEMNHLTLSGLCRSCLKTP